MLTYDSQITVDFLFHDEETDPGWEPTDLYAKRILRKGRLVKARLSFLAQPIAEARPGIAHENWGETTEAGLKYYYEFTRMSNMLIVNPPTFCHCPKHHAAFSKKQEWSKAHLGYASLIFLCGESLFEALAPIQTDDGVGKELLKHVTPEFLIENPALVFIPFVESSRI